MKFVTHTVLPSGEIAISDGPLSTLMVVKTVFVEVCITSTLPLRTFLVTYALVPSGVTTALFGLIPTCIFVIKVLLPVSTTETVVSLMLGIYALG